MTVKSPPPHRLGYPAASSTLTKGRPSGSWLLANNPTLAFSSFLSNDSTDRPILSATRPTSLNSSYSDIATKTAMTKPSSTSQRTRRRSTTAQMQPQPQPQPEQKPGCSISFDTEFPTLTSVSSPLTPTAPDPSSTSDTQYHVWSNAQRIQHKVKSPAKSSWHGDGSDDEDDVNMMEIERLKALVPRRRSHHQGAATSTSSSSSVGAYRRRASSATASRVMITTRTRPPPRLRTITDRTSTSWRQDGDSSASSSSSSSCSSILSPPPPLSPITTNTSSTTTTDPSFSSTQLNDVVTKQDQLRFYLFLKRWTGHLTSDSADPSGWQQRQQHIISRPLPIGTQRHDTYTTPFYN